MDRCISLSRRVFHLGLLIMLAASVGSAASGSAPEMAAAAGLAGAVLAPAGYLWHERLLRRARADAATGRWRRPAQTLADTPGSNRRVA